MNVVEQMLEVLRALPARLEPYTRDLTVPAGESPCARERVWAASQSNGALELSHRLVPRALHAMEVAADALEGLARLLQLPPVQFSPGSVARNVVEAASLVLWLTDAATPVNDRLGRLVRILDHDLDEDRKITNSGLKLMPDRVELHDAKQWTEEQIDQLRHLAGDAGLAVKKMPDMTQLTAQMLDAEYEYRLYSGLSHGSPTAVGAVGGMYQAANSDAVGGVFLYFLQTASDAYCRAAWSYVSFMSDHESTALRATLELVYDELELADSLRSYFRET